MSSYREIHEFSRHMTRETHPANYTAAAIFHGAAWPGPGMPNTMSSEEYFGYWFLGEFGQLPEHAIVTHTVDRVQFQVGDTYYTRADNRGFGYSGFRAYKTAQV